jgi:hypothetical protein
MDEKCLDRGVCLEHSRAISKELEPFSTESIRPASSGTVMWSHKSARARRSGVAVAVSPERDGLRLSDSLRWWKQQLESYEL